MRSAILSALGFAGVTLLGAPLAHAEPGPVMKKANGVIETPQPPRAAEPLSDASTLGNGSELKLPSDFFFDKLVGGVGGDPTYSPQVRIRAAMPSPFRSGSAWPRRPDRRLR